MAETTNPGPHSTPDPSKIASRREAALDEALDRAMADASPAAPSLEVPLKRQWDAELEAEMEAALAGFDPKSFEVARDRPAQAISRMAKERNAGRKRARERPLAR